MPNTSNGYPYPAQSDPVAQGATAIQNLAQAVDTKLGVLAAGAASVPISAIGTVGNTTVTFPAGRFPSAPVAVVTTTQNASLPQNSTSSAAAITATGFTMYAIRTGGSLSPVVVGWVAILI